MVTGPGLRPGGGSQLEYSSGASTSQLRQPPPPVLAKTPLDVVASATGSFVTVGGFGFVVTAIQEAYKRRAVSGGARTAVPYFVFQAALRNGQRWGRVSAGFAGGRAIGQVMRGADDSFCGYVGSIAGGIGAATSRSQVVSSVATFVGFQYLIDNLSSNTEPQQKEASPATPGQKLDRLLGCTPASP